MQRKLFVSIVVPVPQINDLIRKDFLPHLQEQSYRQFELIIIPDKKPVSEKLPDFVKVIPSWPKIGPADKRDLGANKARGEIIAFIDDDAYPDKHWLKNALKYFRNPKNAAVCGPGVTPSEDNFFQQVSGLVWESWFGAGGAGVYRCRQEKKRLVDDYPTFNLLVRKNDFLKVGGFDSKFWPGEDTKFCHDLVYRLKKKIVYDPQVLVYHHRRPIFKGHLKQISRYGAQRGHFARVLPKTSLRLGYLLPSLFLIGFFLGPIIAQLFNLWSVYRLGISLYALFLLIAGFEIFLKRSSLALAMTTMLVILITHFYYGFFFLKGFFSSRGLRKD